jgi:hypothetical protein
MHETVGSTCSSGNLAGTMIWLDAVRLEHALAALTHVVCDLTEFINLDAAK